MAVEAARYLLANKDFEMEDETIGIHLKYSLNPEKESKEAEENGEENIWDQVFEYTEGYSKNDFLSLLAISSFCATMYMISAYYSGERWMENIVEDFNLSVVILCYFTIHVVFKIEHQRSNSYWGRVLHDIQFVFMVMFLRSFYSFLYDLKIEANGSIFYYIGLILGTFILIILLELAINVLLYFLRVTFKWKPI